ncbi:MAG: sel1 repeat family protein [Kiritimatiellaeota bacterium]|nr:sel1 repeat family protein [Kiritimatiellota bacterium]
MKRYIFLGLTLFLLLLAGAAYWSWRAAAARTRQFGNILLTIAALPDPPVVAAPELDDAPDPALIAAPWMTSERAGDEGEAVNDPARFQHLQDRARDALRMIVEQIPAERPGRQKLLDLHLAFERAHESRDEPLAEQNLNAFILGARDLLADEYARRSADSLAKQVDATLTPAALALLKKHPTAVSIRALETVETAKTLPPADAVPLYRAALADLGAALPSAHQDRYNAQLNELQNFADKALDGETPALAVIPLRALATHRPDDPGVRDKLKRAEAALETLLQNFFLLRHNAQKTAEFQKIQGWVRKAADTREPLCAAARALTRDPPDFETAAPLIPVLRQHASPAALFLTALMDDADGAFLAAAERGFVPAFLPAALRLMEDPGVDLDYTQTLALVKAAAKANDRVAQCELALIFLHGRCGVTPDPVMAHHWFVQAANRGEVRAQVNLGLLLVEGIGAAPSVESAFYWFQKAADQDDPVAFYNLGLLALRRVPREVTADETARLFQKSAEAGFAPAQRYLAGFYLDGLLNLPKDPALAFHWAKKSADQDDPVALLFLGMLLNNGLGTTVNKTAALANIIKAANLENPGAMYAAGLLYIEGDGVPKNPTRAREWITKAAAAGFDEAKEWLEENE